MSDKARTVGRPPRVTRVQIAEAALAIGLDRATIRSVAEYLGMSVPGLYHHVSTREDLLAMAAAHGLGALHLPDHEGVPLDEWLARYARFVFDALVEQPALIGQILAGTVNTLRLAQHIERFLQALGAHGVAPDDAYRSYVALMATITGAAVQEVGKRAAEAAGHPQSVDLRRAAAALGEDETPLVHQLVRRRRSEPKSFAAVEAMIDYIGARRRS